MVEFGEKPLLTVLIRWVRVGLPIVRPEGRVGLNCIFPQQPKECSLFYEYATNMVTMTTNLTVLKKIDYQIKIFRL